MAETMIDRLYAESHELSEYLQQQGELSMLASAEASLRKVLLLSAASMFEVRIRGCLIDYAMEKASADESLVSFVKNMAIERQYHRYFTWNGKNANSFFGLFGASFKQYMGQFAKEGTDLHRSIRSFLELGDLRNTLVHEDFGNFPLEKTAAEIYDLYKDALLFVESLPFYLREHSKLTGAPPPTA
jgi:hypothetical protein